MCRNIRILFNFDPPATDEEIRSAAMQYVRKVSGSTKPSKINEPAFEHAIDEITSTTRKLLESLTTNSPPKNREEEREKAKAKAIKRFGTVAAAN
jgi:hypothetical protein